MNGPIATRPRTTAPALAAPEASSFDVELQRATALARAGDVLPRAYRDRPGALLLVDQWARTRGIDTLTAIQTVAFIDGKPVVDAAMQRALAERAGYEVKVLAVTDEHAVVAIYRGGAELGREVYTLDDAKRAGLAQRDNWKKNPRNMMVARASTNALKFYAPSVLLGLGLAEDETPEPLEQLVAQPDPQPEVEGEDIVDAEVIEPEPEVTVDPEPAEDEPDAEPEEPSTEPPRSIEEMVKDMPIRQVVAKLGEYGLDVDGSPKVQRDRLVAYMRNGEPFDIEGGE